MTCSHPPQQWLWFKHWLICTLKRCSGCSQAVGLARCSRRSKPSRNAAGSNEIKEIGKSLLSVGTSRAVCLQCFQWEQSSDLINIQVTVCMLDNKRWFLDESQSLSHHRARSFKYSPKDYRIMQLGNWCFIHVDFFSDHKWNCRKKVCQILLS